MKINLNDYVKVKLTEEGLTIYKLSGSVDKLDNNVLEIQIWKLMYIFGSKMFMCNPHHPFETMKVELKKVC